MGLVEKTGRLADGSAFAEKALAKYRGQTVAVSEIRFKDEQKQPAEGLLITPEGFPYLQFRTSAPDQNGSFFFTSLHYLGGSSSGWNEWTQELMGTGTFRKSGNLVFLNIDGAIETGALTRAKILHNGGKRTGEEALTSLRSRSDRIAALTEWMRSFSNNRNFPDIADFEAFWKPVLLPELVRTPKRPPDYTETGAEWVKAEDVKWNKTYTESLFPEDLRPVRDGGALLRDWEEAPAWIYCIYEWGNIEKTLKENNLVKQ